MWLDAEQKEFTVGRANFAEVRLNRCDVTSYLQLPADLLVRISRQHFHITHTSTKDGSCFTLTDTSGNGTYKNGKLVGKNRSTTLQDGDTIGILMTKQGPPEIELGYVFKLLKSES